MAVGWRLAGVRLAHVGGLGLVLASTAVAQESPSAPSHNAPAIVRLGKWGAAALFVGMTVTGISRHNAADASYRELTGYCKAGGSCLLANDGTYIDPTSEALYQEVIAGDRAARAWLVSGQVALVGAAALFIMQLSYEHGTRNIPYEPHVLVLPGGRMGFGVRWSIGAR